LSLFFDQFVEDFPRMVGEVVDVHGRLSCSARFSDQAKRWRSGIASSP
jgi:hypothetical protein